MYRKGRDCYWQVIDHIEVWSLQWLVGWLGFMAYQAYLSNEMKFLQAVAISVLTLWSHHLDSKEMLREKDKFELQKNAACHFEQILKAALHKQQLYSHLPPILQTIQTRHTGHSWRSRDVFIKNVFQWTPTHKPTSVGWPAKIYIL